MITSTGGARAVIRSIWARMRVPSLITGITSAWRCERERSVRVSKDGSSHPVSSGEICVTNVDPVQDGNGEKQKSG